MDARTRRSWAWRLRKVAVSLFVTAHLGATLLWVIPPSPLREACFPAVSRYLFPTGMWQYWGMFAPDPMRDTLTLEAEVLDAHGLRYAYAFPKLADYSKLAGVPRFRHSKFAANLAMPENELLREMTAHHVVRRLGLADDTFPVQVKLVYQVRVTPPPGGPPADPMTPTTPYVFATYLFPSAREVNP